MMVTLVYKRFPYSLKIAENKQNNTNCNEIKKIIKKLVLFSSLTSSSIPVFREGRLELSAFGYM